MDLNGMNVGLMNNGRGRLVCRTHPEENLFMTGTMFGIDGQRYVIWCPRCGPVSCATADDPQDMQASLDELANELKRRHA